MREHLQKLEEFMSSWSAEASALTDGFSGEFCYLETQLAGLDDELMELLEAIG